MAAQVSPEVAAWILHHHEQNKCLLFSYCSHNTGWQWHPYTFPQKLPTPENKLLVSGVSVFPEKQQNRFLKFAEFLKYNAN